jgi:hypothetical protein
MRSAVVVLLLLASLAGVAACKPGTASNGSRRVYCQVLSDAPERDSDDAPRRVVGRVRFWCDDPGAGSLSLTVQLQWLNSRGGWSEATRTSFTVRGRQTIRTETDRYRIREVSTPCADGVYRTVVSGRSVARGVTTRYSKTSAPSAHPCRAGLLAG